MVRTEYGAKVVQTGTIYMHDFSNPIVQKFVDEMGAVTPIKIVTREWADATHGAWKETP